MNETDFKKELKALQDQMGVIDELTEELKTTSEKAELLEKENRKLKNENDLLKSSGGKPTVKDFLDRNSEKKQYIWR